jgi:hypothetical protein
MPLLLGGTYAVIINRKDSYVVGEPVKLNADEPFAEVKLQMVEGVPVEIEILNPDGSPAVDAQFGLSYSTPWSNDFEGSRRETDRFGKATLEHVNPDVPGSYRITMESRRDVRPVNLPIEVSDSPSRVTIRLESGEVLTGRVVDENGDPIAGVEVYASRHGSGVHELIEAEGKTDAEGRFRFSNMAAAEYSLDTRSPGSIKTVTATGGQEEPVEIRASLKRPSAARPLSLGEIR